MIHIMNISFCFKHKKKEKESWVNLNVFESSHGEECTYSKDE